MQEGLRIAGKRGRHSSIYRLSDKKNMQECSKALSDGCGQHQYAYASVIMLYLKSLTLDRFKSFRHAELLFSKGFTCIVGPNGSGKSNICDALLFSLGESALRRLRANRLESLIKLSKKNDGMRKAYVKVELGGDENLTIVRAVRSDGKSLYRLNGRHVSRQDVLEMLHKYSIRADETSTITQGEISRFIDLRPKERRELIDIASGIKEFEYKKEEALKELEKVGQKISESNIMLNERKGFLSELGAEKEAAEKYIKMAARLKSLNYSILVSKKAEAERLYAAYSESLEKLSAKRNGHASLLGAVSATMSAFAAERSRLTQQLNESAKNVGETSSRLEAINMGLASLGAEISGMQSGIADAEKGLEELRAEEKKAAETAEGSRRRSAELDSEIKAREPELEKLSAAKARPPEETAIKRLESKNAELEKISSDAQAEASDAGAEISSLRERLSQKKAESGRTAGLSADAKARQTRIAEEIEKLRSDHGRLHSEGKDIEARLSATSREIGNADELSINIREQRALLKPKASAAYDVIKSAFGKENGLHGRLGDLCTYDDEYAPAVDAAVGARLDYIVVDSMETAAAIIEHLKKNAAGRATFIPLKEVKAEETRRHSGISPIMDFIKFDGRFAPAFRYALHNTYLVKDIGEAKAHGIGQRRYVTMSGEVIEQSGILSGGSSPKRLSPQSLEKRLREVLEKRSQLSSEHDSLNAKLLEKRKGEAYVEMNILSLEKELGSVAAQVSEHSKLSLSISKEIGAIGAQLSNAEKKHAAAESLLKSTRELLSGAKAELSSIYATALEASKRPGGLTKAEAERLEGIRKDVEGFRIAKAGSVKEGQIAEESMKKASEKIAQKILFIKESKKAIGEKSSKKKDLEEARGSLEGEMARQSTSGKELFKCIGDADAGLASEGEKKGRAEAELSNIERQISDLKVQGSQSATRMNDLAAELSTYREKAELINDDVAAMEKESGVTSAKMAELGSVNMKAPELYDEKKRAVDEVMSRLGTLETERQAVMRMINEIESKKLQTFMNALNEVSKNFSTLYSHVFTNRASIKIENPKDPFNSGLDIEVSDGRSTKTLGSMSGGEKSFISLILIFAIHMYKPSSLYIFDEVDVALDKENSKKLSYLIKEMGKNAQFIVVSHNDSLILNADTAIGVVKNDDESKTVGIEVSSMVKGRS